MAQQSSISEHEFESRVERFENAWQRGERPVLEQFLGELTGPDAPAARRGLLAELVMIDLEYRWRRPAAVETDALPAVETVPEDSSAATLPPSPRLEDYLAEFPELGPLNEMPLELIVEEYRVRHRWGDRPGHEEYTSRLADRAAELTPLLQKADEELHHDVAAPGSVEHNAENRGSHVARSVAPAPMLPADKTVGRFELCSVLGQGAFGTVYLAHDPQLDRSVALKIPRAEAFGGRSEIQRFLREARSAAQLRHPYIVPVYEAGQFDDTYYIACGYVAGHTLREELKRGRRFTHLESARLICQLAEALDYAHNQGIVHRDIKPENVMLDVQGRPHIMDFGSARRAEGDALETQEGVRMGTPAYMSPEQATGHSHLADGRADLWSLGVMLYELLAGRRPFEGSGFEVLMAVRDTEPASLRTIDKRIPQDLETICAICMTKSPEQRYPSCRHLVEELERWSRGSPVHARREGAAEAASGSRARMTGVLAAIACVLVVGLLIGRFVIPGQDTPAVDPQGHSPGDDTGLSDGLPLPPPLNEPAFSWTKAANSPDLPREMKRVAAAVADVLKRNNVENAYAAPFSGMAGAQTDNLLAARLAYALLEEADHMTVSRRADTRVSVDYGLTDFNGQTGVAVILLHIRILNRRLEQIDDGDLRLELTLQLLSETAGTGEI